MLPFLTKRKEAPATVITDGSRYSDLSPETDEQSKEEKLKQMQALLLDALVANILCKMSELNEGDESHV